MCTYSTGSLKYIQENERKGMEDITELSQEPF